jgi:hypothetical protein
MVRDGVRWAAGEMTGAKELRPVGLLVAELLTAEESHRLGESRGTTTAALQHDGDARAASRRTGDKVRIAVVSVWVWSDPGATTGK